MLGSCGIERAPANPTDPKERKSLFVPNRRRAGPGLNYGDMIALDADPEIANEFSERFVPQLRCDRRGDRTFEAK